VATAASKITAGGVCLQEATQRLLMCARLILSNILWFGIVVRADNC